MANERVRATVYQAGLGVDDVAEALGIDRKTVERWIDGHVPYRRNQHALAKLLSVDPGYLWPATSADEARALGMAELLAIWPVRSLVPNTTWVDLFEQAKQSIDILVFAGFWLSEDPAVRGVLADKAEAQLSNAAGRKRRSARPSGPRSRTPSTTTARSSMPLPLSSGSMARPSTARSTGRTKRCWLTPTCTGCRAT